MYRVRLPHEEVYMPAIFAVTLSVIIFAFLVSGVPAAALAPAALAGAAGVLSLLAVARGGGRVAVASLPLVFAVTALYSLAIPGPKALWVAVLALIAFEAIVAAVQYHFLNGQGARRDSATSEAIKRITRELERIADEMHRRGRP